MRGVRAVRHLLTGIVGNETCQPGGFWQQLGDFFCNMCGSVLQRSAPTGAAACIAYKNTNIHPPI